MVSTPVAKQHGGQRKGAGRPPKNDPLIKRTIAMHAADWAAFDAIKKETTGTNPGTIRELIEHYRSAT